MAYRCECGSSRCNKWVSRVTRWRHSLATVLEAQRVRAPRHNDDPLPVEEVEPQNEDEEVHTKSYDNFKIIMSMTYNLKYECIS